MVARALALETEHEVCEQAHVIEVVPTRGCDERVSCEQLVRLLAVVIERVLVRGRLLEQQRAAQRAARVRDVERRAAVRVDARDGDAVV